MSPRASAVAADRRDVPQNETRPEASGAAFQNAIDAARVSSEESIPPVNAGDTPIRSANDNAADVAAAARDVSPQRQQQIADWVERQSDPSGGFLGIGQTATTEKVIGALRGQSELGALDQQQQRLLMDRMLDRWTAGRGEGPGSASRLSRSLDDAPELRSVVAERTALEAAELARDPAIATAQSGEQWQRRMTAASYAVSAITAVSGPAGGAPADLEPLRNMLNGLRPEDAAGFARALSTDASVGFAGQMTASMRERALSALNQGPQSEAASAFVQNAFAGTSAADYSSMPTLRPAMAHALAREWHPDDLARQRAEAGRLGGILETRQGRQLLGSQGADKAPLAARVNALATIRMNPAITADTLRQTDDPWTNRAIVEPQAQASAQRLLSTRGDAPQRLRGTDLDNTIGFAMGMPPVLPPGTSFAQAQAGASRGELSLYASGEHAAAVRAVTDQIRAVGGADAQVTVLPVTYSSAETGPVQLPLFRVAGADGRERFVDNVGRAYDSFDDWRENNQLPPGSTTYPSGGHLTARPDGSVALEHGNTPKTVDSFGEHFSQVVDKVALVGGIVAGGVLIVGTGGLATPIVIGAGAVAVGAGAWGAYRSGSELADRADHGQSIDPFSDETARGLWLNVGASALSIGAFGSAARLAQLGRAGRAIAPVESSLHGYVQAGAAIVDTAAIANESIYLSRHWNGMSGEQRAQSLLSMGFWAAGTGAAMRAGGLRPGDMFNPIAVRDGLLRNFAPQVAPDGSLQGNAVQIDYDPATGAVRGIRHSPQATAADIELHVATAQNIQRSLTLEGQLRTFFTQHGEPRAGTVGWAARIDISKIRERMEMRSRELADPGLTAQRRADIVRANAFDQQHLDQLAEDVSSFVRDPGRAVIEARNTRSQPGERPRIVLEPGNKADGWNQALNGELVPNTDYVVGRYTYTTDEAGRVVEAGGRVRLNRHDRNTHQQGKAAEVGGIKDAVDGDQGGHLFAAMFDGPGEQINYHPMTRELNGGGGDWYNMEQEWRTALEQNRTVDARIRAEFDGDSKRPAAFRVTFWIDGKKHTRFFENASE
ncbi:DUF4781 domain-containing protein [Bradyrhizobium sp. CSA112]|uniref:DUF4781 domain-containing protein n=1 Tax=Bradyrhizobium sp. CSA112 TaxID=2699170 RepID=UPI0023B0A32E|nr:DUF4781 domain-containing protein [Bradyrhizobium sp. CSA112]MDE5453991.1 DUF4781 domain-containing protein [Bradyrhizobium sp. CSA112]